MFLSAKAFFNDRIGDNITLIKQANTQLPAEFVKHYKKNVAPITPMKTGALRRSIITQVLGTRAQIGWRAPYAMAQDDGGHTVPHAVKGPNTRDGGYGTIAAGFYRYSRYTTPGTGPNFAHRAFMQTVSEMPSVYRELGMTN